MGDDMTDAAADRRRALVLVDVNNAFFDERGQFHYPAAGEVLPGIRALLEAARGAGTLVIHVREAHHPGLNDFETQKLPAHCIAGEFDAAPYPGFEAVPGEPELGKRRYSAFFATDLNLLLREQGIQEVIFAGVKTNVCMRASVQDAFAHGFRPALVRGAVNSNRPNLHEAALEDVERYFGEVIDLDEGVARLGGSR
jgi:nicotinamidase-related amidase